eukprot:1371215-Amorphochlora_amoeboformis.AAC.3
MLLENLLILSELFRVLGKTDSADILRDTISNRFTQGCLLIHIHTHDVSDGAKPIGFHRVLVRTDGVALYQLFSTGHVFGGISIGSTSVLDEIHAFEQTDSCGAVESRCLVRLEDPGNEYLML